LKIYSYLPSTFCDYPGKVAAIIFTQGCNFRCPWCHNTHLIGSGGEGGGIDVASFLPEVASRCRAGLLDGLVVTGGEPTVQPGLPGFLRECKAAGIPVKLDTNGSRPEILRALFGEQLLAFVAMDIKAPPAKYELLCGCPVDTAAILESISLIVSSGLPHQFRTTLVPGLLTDSDLAAIRALLPPGETLATQEYRR